MKRLFPYMLLLVVSLLSATPQSVSAQQDRVYKSLSEVRNPERVYQLKLCHKHLHQVPEEIRSMTNLRVLDLGKNAIIVIPAWIGELQNLEELYIDRNHVCSIPPEIARLSNLKILDASRNPILELPDVMGEMSGLQKLILWATGVYSLPPTFVALNESLKVLDLRSNRLSHQEQEALRELLPDVTKLWDQSCNCK